MARITVWLFVESTSLAVEEMAARIGLSPDRCWRIGDSRCRGSKTYQTNSWCLERVIDGIDENPNEVGAKLQECLNSVLNRIEGLSAEFRAVAEGNVSGLYVGVTANEAPCIQLGAATLDSVACLGVDVEIDLML